MTVPAGDLNMAFVGDVAMGNHPKTPGFGFYSRYRDGIPPELAARVTPPGVSCDLLFGNLEFALTADGRLLDTNTCCIGHVGYAEFLKDAGFTVLNMANNHAWQYGCGVYEETVRALQKVGIKVIGIPDDYDPAHYLRIAGKTVALLGVSQRPRQGFTDAPGYNEFDEADLLGRIRDARRVADVVCVSIHWGQEFIVVPSHSERRVARAMVDAGADVVVGHHPHVLREVECYRGRVIAYSLGNFIGDMTWNPATRRSGCLHVRTRESGIALHKFMPASIDDDFFPRFLGEGDREEYLLQQRQSFETAGADARQLGYAVVAQQALRRHQLLTLKFLVRNISKYRLSTLSSILSHAVSVRFRGIDC